MIKIRVAYILVFIFTLFLNVWLMVKDHSSMTMPLLVLSSGVLSIFFVMRIELMTNSGEPHKSNATVSLTRRLIDETPLTPFSYVYFKVLGNTRPTEGLTFIEILTDPVLWIFCIFVFFSLFTASPYQEFDKNNHELILKLVGATSLQLLTLSSGIAGLLMFFREKLNKA